MVSNTYFAVCPEDTLIFPLAFFGFPTMGAGCADGAGEGGNSGILTFAAINELIALSTC